MSQSTSRDVNGKRRREGETELAAMARQEPQSAARRTLPARRRRKPARTEKAPARGDAQRLRRAVFAGAETASTIAASASETRNAAAIQTGAPARATVRRFANSLRAGALSYQFRSRAPARVEENPLCSSLLKQGLLVT